MVSVFDWRDECDGKKVFLLETKYTKKWSFVCKYICTFFILQCQQYQCKRTNISLITYVMHGFIVFAEIVWVKIPGSIWWPARKQSGYGIFWSDDFRYYMFRYFTVHLKGVCKYI